MSRFGKLIVALALASAFSRETFAQQMIMMPPLGESKAVPSLAPMLERVLPGVVSILVTGERVRPIVIGSKSDAAEPTAEPFRSGGSGVVVDAERGIILTNHHVIVDAKHIEISLSDGRTGTAELVGSDVATDVAVIRTELRDLTAVPYADSDRLRVGDFICAVGSPFGLDGSASQGIVSALMRTDIGYGIFEDFIQVDAAVNPGNSGGALVDLAGRLVGINTATGSARLRTQGISFAIPINLARSVAKELERNGTFKRGALGFVTENIGYEMARAMNLPLTRGAAVTAVLTGSPAAAAGVQIGQVIVAIDGKPIRNHGDYVARVATTPIGHTLTVSLVSGGSRRDVPMTVADMIVPPTPVAAPSELASLRGLNLGAMLPGFKAFGVVQGARVLTVEAAAARIGLKADDVVTKVDTANVRSPSDVFDAASSKMGRFRLEIFRDGRTYWIWVDA
jgi:S1-C subfamily serine protease